MTHLLLRALTTLAILAPASAFAHTGIGDTGGFAYGFAHPIGGTDHVLAMIAVGLLAGQLGGRALWLLPATFVVVMAAGGAIGIAGIDIPFIEIGIALSVAVFGAMIALGAKAPVALAMAIVGVFAIFHGHAHGTEMPANSSGALYAAGFMMATAILHVAGIALGGVIGRVSQASGPMIVRSTGALTCLAGIHLLTKLT